MSEQLEISKEIIQKAIIDYQPYAVVAMVSGGDDSLTALHVAKNLGVNIDFILHGITQTGIPDTLDFVRSHCSEINSHYIEADAKDSYEKYVLRKGFFGVGKKAHEFAYHVLKREHFGKAISHHIRQRKRNRKILLINGVRSQESKRRAAIHNSYVIEDGSNIWVNLILDWSKFECLDYLEDHKISRNPVTELIHRSGECMCGTMQSYEDRREACYWFPKWGKWLDNLEQRVCEAGFYWKWGEEYSTMIQPNIWDEEDVYLPMCSSCVAKNNKNGF